MRPFAVSARMVYSFQPVDSVNRPVGNLKSKQQICHLSELTFLNDSSPNRLQVFSAYSKSGPEGFFNLPGTDGVGGVCQLCAENCTKQLGLRCHQVLGEFTMLTSGVMSPNKKITRWVYT